MSKRISNKKGGGGARSGRTHRKGVANARVRMAVRRAMLEEQQKQYAIRAPEPKPQPKNWMQRAAGAVRRFARGV